MAHAASTHSAEGVRVTEFNPIVVGFQVVMLANMIGLAVHFASASRARGSAARIDARHAVFRVAMILVLVGVALNAISDGVRWTADLDRENAIVNAVRIGGTLMIAIGLTAINTILLTRPREERSPTGPASGA